MRNDRTPGSTYPCFHGARRKKSVSGLATLLAMLLILPLISACASVQARDPYTTKRDKTAKGAGAGAAAGAVGAILAGEREADEILAGAAIGAVVGGSIGAYMDHQEERLTRIPGTTVERVSENTILAHFDSDVLFDVDSASLRADAQSTLRQVGSVLLDYPKTAIVIQGHTDSTGTEEHNQALSRRRAESVEAFLIGRGVEPTRLTAVGYGESMPVATNETEAGRQQNRRVDILLKAKAK
ncbi:MAG: OmpA family protein [Thermoanaerobaculia bacterium]|nr:OmpA family protein [Thermoanaerobaculia bacterium]